MITQDEAYEIISGINEEAHRLAFDSWQLADSMDDEGDTEGAEEQRDIASEEQQEYFLDDFYDLPQETQDAIMHYAKTNEDFGDEFASWSGIDLS